MPVKSYALGEWLPDVAGRSGVTSIARNVLSTAAGYAPAKAFQSITDALPEAFFGGGAFVASDGTTSLLAGTSVGLYLFSGSSWSLVIADAASSRWRFTQFGDNVICANGGKLISYDLITQTAAEISSSPDNCIDVARVRDFVVAIRDDDTAEWCEFNDSADWGTGENQADFQPLLGGGKGVAIAGGENGLVLQKNSIQRMSYVGGDAIFQFDPVADEVGCMARGSVAGVNNVVFWLSERGFMMSPDRASIVPIGDEKFNRWFFANFSRADIEAGIYAAVDPRQSLVMWSMPGSPGKILVYNWVLQRATYFELDVTGIYNGFTNNLSIEAMDALYADMDSASIPFDDASLQGGNPLFLIADTSGVVGALEGTNLEARVQIDNVEPTPGRRSRIRALRPVTDATSVDLTVDARMKAGDSESLRSAGSMRTNGKCNIRSNGRYNDVSVTIDADENWSYLQAVECEFEAGDGR